MASKKPLPAELETRLQKMIEAGEPEENLKWAIARYNDDHDTVTAQTLHELKGVIEEAAPAEIASNVWAVVRGLFWDLPAGTIKDTISVLKGGTPENAKAFVEGIHNLPHEVNEATHEERGQMIGSFLTQAATIGLSPKYTPAAGRAALRGVGTAVETTGKKAAWPLRIVASHMVGQPGAQHGILGRAAGLGLLAAPEMLQTAGKALKEMGTPNPERALPGLLRLGVSPQKGIKGDPTAAGQFGLKTGPSLRLNPSGQSQAINTLRGKLERTLGDVETGAMTPPETVTSSLDQGIADAKKQGSTTRQANQRFEKTMTAAEQKADMEQARTEEQARASKQIADARQVAGVEPRTPTFTTTQSATTPTGRETQTTRFGPHIETPEEELARITKGGGGPSTPPMSQTEIEARKAAVRATRSAPTPEPVTPTPEGDEAHLAELNKIREGARLAPESNEEFAARMRAKRQASPRPPIKVDPESVKKVGGVQPTSVEAPPQKAWSPETDEQVGVGIPREPPRLVLSPEEAQVEEQQLRAFKPSARVQGMKAAARVPRTDGLEKFLAESGMSEIEKAQMRRLVLGQQ